MRVEVSSTARYDIRLIYEVGLINWGEDQADSYQDRIEAVFQHIGHHPELGVRRGDLGEKVRVFPVERHRVFYEIAEFNVIILRIIHANVDESGIFAN